MSAETGDAGEDSKSSTSSVLGTCSKSRAQILASVTGGRKTAIARGFAWLDDDVPYSQSGSHGGYRTDCSGFVSMCWQLGQSFTSADFASGAAGAHKLASYDALVPGDALVKRASGSGHVTLFLAWNDASHSGACVLEQASTASDMQFRVRPTSSLQSDGFKAIAADALGGETVDDQADDPTETSPGAEADPSETSPSEDAPSGSPPAEAEGIACGSDGFCNPGNDGSGKICVSGHCVSGCRIDAHCPGITTCVSGRCE